MENTENREPRSTPQSGNSAGETAGQKPGNSVGKKPGQATGQKPRQTAGQKSGQATGQTAGTKPAENTEAKPILKIRERPVEKPVENTGDNTAMQENRPLAEDSSAAISPEDSAYVEQVSPGELDGAGADQPQMQEAPQEEPGEKAAATSDAEAVTALTEQLIAEKKNRILKITLLTLLVAIAGVLLLYFVPRAVRLWKTVRDFEVYEEESVTYLEPAELVTEEDDEEEIILSLNELRSADDLSTALREWAENSDDYVLMKSKKVINFLLIGCDENQKLADVIMIVSLNLNTKQIFLTSVMRDSYTYIPIKNSDTYGKINSAYQYGGAPLVKSTIERDYKIAIDYYVSVNYDMLVGIVNTMGGIELNVEAYEAQAIVSDELFVDLARLWDLEIECPYGEQVTLNGLQALTYCRIRHCDTDADISRTRRQRQLIGALIEKSKSVSLDQIDAILDQFSIYLRTDCPKNELVELATKAITGKWYNYELISNSFPQEGERLDYSGYAWVWIVDYPLSAYNLHNLIYGESNIILSEDRISVIDIMQYTGNTGTAAP